MRKTLMAMITIGIVFVTAQAGNIGSPGATVAGNIGSPGSPVMRFIGNFILGVITGDFA